MRCDKQLHISSSPAQRTSEVWHLRCQRQQAPGLALPLTVALTITSHFRTSVTSSVR